MTARRAGRCRGRHPRRALAAALGVVLAATSCAVSNLNLVNDHRLRFLSPPSRAHLHLPVTLRWTIRGFAPAAGAGAASRTRGSFALFVDRSPVRPGQTLSAIASSDRSCRHTPGCPGASYFTDRQIYTTAADSFELDHVDNLSGNREKQQLHEVTVVLLDPSGHRIGESAWYRQFWLPQAGLS